MKMVNTTPFIQGVTIGLGPGGAAYFTVLIKATYSLPRAPGSRPEVAAEQRPLTTEDEFIDGDVTRSLHLEKDTVPFKPRADVVLVGTASAPGGRPVNVLDVMLRVGRLRKVLRVFGDREWIFPTRMVMVPLIGEPKPFVQMPLTYEHAFGGIDRKAGRGCTQNYVGKGFLGKKKRETVHGKPLPNIEDPARLITSWNDEPLPAGFGFYAPHCQPRAAFIGTEQGATQPHPLFGLASDFRHDFFNAAHPELQIPGYLRGDEEVELVNMTPDGPRRFHLPGLRPVVSLHVRDEQPVPVADGASATTSMPEAAASEPGIRHLSLEAPLDTLVLLPDEDQFYLVWRAAHSLGALTDADALSEALLRLAGLQVDIAPVLPAQGAGYRRP